MDFPFPIRSLTSIVDLSTPLFVDTDIVYKIDETKFPGLKKSYHALQPALILESGISPNSCAEPTGPYVSTNICGDEIRHIYNFIDTLEAVHTVVLPEDPNVDMLDLPDIRLELPDDEISTENKKSNQLDCVTGEKTDFFSPFSHVYNLDEVNVSPRCEINRISSCRFTSTSMSTKRNYLSSALHDDLTHPMHPEERTCKKRKSDLNKFGLTNYSRENCFDNVTYDFCSQTSLYHQPEPTFVFNSCDSSVKMHAQRQW